MTVCACRHEHLIFLSLSVTFNKTAKVCFDFGFILYTELCDSDRKKRKTKIDCKLLFGHISVRCGRQPIAIRPIVLRVSVCWGAYWYERPHIDEKNMKHEQCVSHTYVRTQKVKAKPLWHTTTTHTSYAAYYK